jgi:hypothetical protein
MLPMQTFQQKQRIFQRLRSTWHGSHLCRNPAHVAAPASLTQSTHCQSLLLFLPCCFPYLLPTTAARTPAATSNTIVTINNAQALFYLPSLCINTTITICCIICVISIS